MSEFPNNFDYVIYGTGIVESVLSAALSTTGSNVLHLDKNEYYGGFSGCLRLSELEHLFKKWDDTSLTENSDNIFQELDDYVKHVSYNWNVKNEIENSENAKESCNSETSSWTELSLRQSLRTFEFELLPRILFSESRTIDALIQSDVTRYLEFKFISKFVTLCDDEKIITIPINRSDIVKTRVFSLRQKRLLTSFLEWCFMVDLNDELVTQYADRPLYELMRNEKNMDTFTEKIIIECMAFSSQNVETKRGISKIKRLLHSFNKFGPYPLLWPNYGCGEIPQAFCRMSAVFGCVYSLNTSILTCTSQATQNGEYEHTEERPDEVPVNYRKLKLTLSNNSCIYTDKIITNKSCIKSDFFTNIERTKWVARAILVTDKSLISEIRENSDILMFSFHLDLIEQPAILLELQVENYRQQSASNQDKLYVVYLTAFSSTICDSKDLFRQHIGKIFEKYTGGVDREASEKPQILLECYFTLPDFSDIGIDTQNGGNSDDDLSHHLVLVGNSAVDIEFDDCFKEAQDVFSAIQPGVEFLPRPPNPEDIIQLGDETVSSVNLLSGDFPFETDVSAVQSPSGVADFPGAGESSSPISRSVAVGTTTGPEDNLSSPIPDFLADLELNSPDQNQ